MADMGAGVIKKIMERVPILIGITFLSFAVIHLSPGTPVDGAGSMDPRISSEARQKIEVLYGLDKPVWEQYVNWVLKVVRLDFGNSFIDGQKVTDKIAEAIPVTLLLQGVSLLIVVVFGVMVGMTGAVYKDRWPDKISGFIVALFIAMPSFCLALWVMSYLGVTLRIFPVSGLHELFYEEKSNLYQLWDLARHLILPIAVSSLAPLAAMSRYLRSETLRVLNEDHVRAARAKGLSEGQVLSRHVLRNALLPVITLLGLSVPGLLGGSVVLESLFSIPGMGRLFYSSVFMRDYPTIMGILVLGAFLTLAGNLLADLAYYWADPRIRVAKRS